MLNLSESIRVFSVYNYIESKPGGPRAVIDGGDGVENNDILCVRH
jgi:hypothetical protein